MSMTFDQIYDHYNSLDPVRQISRNTPDSVIVTTTYSQFKTICSTPNVDVKMAEFKRVAFELFPEVARIVGNNNIVIRLGKRENFLEAYDVMLINLDEPKIQEIYNLFNSKGLIDEGYRLLVVTFILPKNEDQEVADKLLTMMFKYIPKTEKASEFFGYIL